MAFCNCIASTVRRVLRPAQALTAFLFAAVALGGCSVATDGVGALMVDPSRYEGYNCKDLTGQWTTLVKREKELRNLIDRADDGGGAGVVVGAVAYRGDYQTVLEQEKLLQHTAAEKKCQLKPPPTATATFTSDQTIR